MIYTCNLFPHNITVISSFISVSGTQSLLHLICHFYQRHLIQLVWNLQFLRKEEEEEGEEECSRVDTDECHLGVLRRTVGWVPRPLWSFIVELSFVTFDCKTIHFLLTTSGFVDSLWQDVVQKTNNHCLPSGSETVWIWLEQSHVERATVIRGLRHKGI